MLANVSACMSVCGGLCPRSTCTLALRGMRLQRDACSSDAQRYCADVPSQGGRLNQCLLDHVDKLTAACNRVVTQLMHEEMMALDVLPIVQDACHTQLRQFCRDIEPGEGRLFECLVKKRTEKAFDNRCQAALFSQQVRRPRLLLFLTIGLLSLTGFTLIYRSR